MDHYLVFFDVEVLGWATTVTLNLYNNNYDSWIIKHYLEFYSKAAAPEIISINSLVITACLVRLNVKVNLLIISPK